MLSRFPSRPSHPSTCRHLYHQLAPSVHSFGPSPRTPPPPWTAPAPPTSFIISSHTIKVVMLEGIRIATLPINAAQSIRASHSVRALSSAISRFWSRRTLPIPGPARNSGCCAWHRLPRGLGVRACTSRSSPFSSGGLITLHVFRRSLDAPSTLSDAAARVMPVLFLPVNFKTECAAK